MIKKTQNNQRKKVKYQKYRIPRKTKMESSLSNGKRKSGNASNDYLAKAFTYVENGGWNDIAPHS